MAKAGKRAQIKISGEPVVFTDEATTTSDNTTYRITNQTKTPWCRVCTITVEDGGVPTAESFTLNRLTGEVTFTSSAVRTITVTGSYLPTTTVAEANEFSYSIEGNNEDVTFFTKDYMLRKQALKDFTGSFSQWSATDRTAFNALLGADDVVGEAVGTGDGLDTTFNLDNFPIVPNSETIYLDGVPQSEGTNYTINDTTGLITFTVAPANGVVITADYQFFTDEEINFVIEFWHDFADDWDLRAWAVIASDELSAPVDGIIDQAVDFEGNADNDKRVVSMNP